MYTHLWFTIGLVQLSHVLYFKASLDQNWDRTQLKHYSLQQTDLLYFILLLTDFKPLIDNLNLGDFITLKGAFDTKLQRRLFIKGWNSTHIFRIKQCESGSRSCANNSINCLVDVLLFYDYNKGDVKTSNHERKANKVIWLSLNVHL